MRDIIFFLSDVGIRDYSKILKQEDPNTQQERETIPLIGTVLITTHNFS